MNRAEVQRDINIHDKVAKSKTQHKIEKAQFIKKNIKKDFYRGMSKKELIQYE